MISSAQLNIWTQERLSVRMARKCVGTLLRSLSRCPHGLNIPMQICILVSGSLYVLFFSGLSVAVGMVLEIVPRPASVHRSCGRSRIGSSGRPYYSRPQTDVVGNLYH